MKIHPLHFTGFLAAWIVLAGQGINTHAANGSVVLQFTNNGVNVKVDGDKDDDWWIQTSTNLLNWTTVSNLGTLLSGNETNAAWRTMAGPGDGPQYYRALQTAGLYDPTLFRTVSLTFSQANWGDGACQCPDGWHQYLLLNRSPQQWGDKFRGGSAV